MEEKIMEVCRKITPHQFETMLLLYESAEDRLIIGCDVGELSRYKCYKFIEKSNNKNYLLVIWYSEEMPDFPEISKLYPQYDSFTLADYTDDSEKPYYIRWLCKQSNIPDFLVDICDEVKNIIQSE